MSKKTPKDPDHYRQFVADVAASGLNPTDLAREIGKDKNFVRDYIELRKGSMGAVEDRKLQAILRQRLATVTTEITQRNFVDDVSKDIIPLPFDQAEKGALPIYSGAEGGDGNMHIAENDLIDLVERPAYVKHAKRPFGVLIFGESMDPEFEPNTLAIVNPDLPPLNGKTHIFTTDPEGGQFKATIKRLVKQTDRAWIVFQRKPFREFELLKSEWVNAYRVVGRQERG